jgi:hypothetical protein
MTSLLYSASCFESISSSSDSNADLKQPLVEVQDLESSSRPSSQDEQKTEKNADPRLRRSNLVLVKSLCFGSFVGLLLQAVTLSAFLVINKKWGENPEESLATLSYRTLYLVATLNTVVYSIIWTGFMVSLTRKGSMYMRNFFDNEDADAPNTESVCWTPRFLLLSGIGFLLGLLVGSHAAWAVVNFKMGMPLPLTPLLFSLLMDMGCCYLVIKCFDWAHEITGYYYYYEPEEDEDSFFV